MRVHPQSAVGLMSMGGKGPEVLSTFTSDFGSILAGLHRTKIHGTSHLSSSIQVAGVSGHSSRGEMAMLTMNNLVGAQASFREVPAATNYRVFLLPDRRR